MTSQPRDKTRDSTKHDTAKFGIDLYSFEKLNYTFLRPKLCYRLVNKYTIINLHTCNYAQFKHFFNLISGKMATF